MIETILEFWFGAAARAQWFAKDPAFDALIRDAYLALYETAAAGGLRSWEDGPRGALALVLVLDQFPRNMFRGQPRAFAADPLARAVAERAIAAGHDQNFDQLSRSFFYLPFEHSEDLADQQRCTGLMASLTSHPDLLRWAWQHRRIIERFGRFPHRNPILGRASSAAEQRFLAAPGSSF